MIFIFNYDVLLLAGVFETFLIEYMIVGNFWDLMQRFTGVNLKLISDIKKNQFIERMVKGAISVIS